MRLMLLGIVAILALGGHPALAALPDLDEQICADLHAAAIKLKEPNMTAQPQADGAYHSRFDGKLVLVLLDDKEHGALRGGRTVWALEECLAYRPFDRKEQITLPRGAHTDLASIPRFLWSVFPPDGPWAKASVVHDFLYRTKGTGVYWPGKPSGNTRQKPYDREEADNIFREAMADRGVGVVSRNLIWAGVRLGGWMGWGH